MRPFAFLSTSGAAPGPFDPASLALSGWWRASYAGSPWTPTASAGASGGNGNLTEGTNPPSVGAPLNGFDTADFDGTNDQISPGGTADTFVDTEAFSGWILFNADAVSSDSPTPYLNPCLITTGPSAYFCIGLRSSGELGVRFVASGEAIVTDAFTIGDWTLVQWKYDGANMKLRVNGGAWQSTACTGVFGDTSNVLHFGRNYAPDSFFNGQIAEIGLADVTLSDGTFDNIVDYVNTRYALSF